MATKKSLESLSPAQEALIPILRDKWLEIGLRTGNVDLPKAKKAMSKVYAAADLPAPVMYFVAESPYTVATMSLLVTTLIDYLHSEETDALIDTREFGAFADVVQSTIDQLAAQLKSKAILSHPDLGLGCFKRMTVADRLAKATKVVEHIAAKLAAMSPTSVAQQLAAIRSKCCYGSHDAGWLAFYDYWKEIGVLPADHLLTGLTELAQVCGWWYPTRCIAILDHRPSVLQMVDGRLHCEDGPSIEYPDGLQVWSILGVRVTEQIVMSPDTQTIAQIQAEENVEVKRIRIERFGWDKYLNGIGAAVMDTRRNDIEGTMEVLYSGDDMVVLRTFCPSTGRIYALEVDSGVTSCGEAQSWLWGINDADTAIIGRT